MRYRFIGLILGIILLLPHIAFAKAGSWSEFRDAVWPKGAVQTLSDDGSFTKNDIGDTGIRTFLVDPGGSNRNYDPSGDFVTWTILTIENTADAAETITFDSSGIAVAIAQDRSATFIYNGSAWEDISTGILDDDLLTLSAPTAWRLFYSNGSSVITELTLGANGTFLESNGASAAPAFRVLAAGDIPDISATYCIVSTNANGYDLLDEAASSTNPTLVPDKTDPNSGVTHSGADSVGFGVGGVEAVRYTENGGVLHSQQVTTGITASTTQSQGQGALTSSVNEISTCANDNDTVTLPSSTALSDNVLVINNGANTLQVFPASGDNLGNGVNASTTIAAGSLKRFVSYDATNWEEMTVTSARFTVGAATQDSGNGDTTPNVSNAAVGTNNVYDSNSNGQITDFVDSTGDHSDFSTGDWFVFIMDDASSSIKFNDNTNIEGNAAVNFTGSATQIVSLIFEFRSARWNCLNLLGGYSTPTTLSLSAINMADGVFAAPCGTNPTTDADGEISLDESDVGQVPLFLEAYDDGVGDTSRIIGSDIHCESFTIAEPDSLVSVEPNINLKYFKSMGYPHGATIVGISVGTDGTDCTNDTINFERWTTEDDGSPDTIENIDMSGVDNKDDDGTLTNAAMAANDYFVADITGWDDDIPLLIITICYRINPGD